MFDVLIIGGGVSGISSALIFGSAKEKSFMQDKKIGVIAHQKSSSLQEAVFNNAYGIAPGTLGADLLNSSLEQLQQLYSHIEIIFGEKVIKVEKENDSFVVYTNKGEHRSKIVVVAIGSSNTFGIEGLMQYVEPHKKALASKNRIQLKNDDHKVAEGIYVAGTLAGWRSQLSIAAGSGASVATDIMTLWNGGIPVQSHDSIKK